MIRLLKLSLAVLALATAPVRAMADGIGLNLAGLVDWSTQLPFLDMMKLSRPFVGHAAGKWGAMKHEELVAAGVFDAHGWPTRIPPELEAIGTMVLTGLPKDTAGAAGRYLLRYEGQGTLELGGGARDVSVTAAGIEFSFEPGGGSVPIAITATDPAGTGDYIRNISVVRTDRVADADAGALFNPDWLARLDGFEVLRFMDWGHTNNATLAQWDDRPEPGDASYAENGAPVEVMLRLANETGIDPWFTMPHLADDGYVRAFAETVHTGLAPGLTAHVEYSNEVWNWAFGQARWAEDRGLARWGRKGAWVQYYAMRATEVADIWAEVWGPDAADGLVRVISTQTARLGLEKDILNAPLWLAEDPTLTPPAAHFDAYAITGYFGGHLGRDDWPDRIRRMIADSEAAATAEADARGLDGTARDDYFDAHRYDLATAMLAGELAEGDGALALPRLVGEIFPYHARVAEAAGLELLAYEGGTHVVALKQDTKDEALTAFLTHFNYTPEMGALYARMLDGWAGLGAGPFLAFNDVSRPSKWGSWGHLRHLGDSNPRWDALLAARDRETVQ